MPFVHKPTCSSCKSTNSSLWRKGNGNVYCSGCAKRELDGIEDAPSLSGSNSDTKLVGKDIAGGQFMGPLRKSSRIKPSKYKYQPTIKPLATKGKSRRVVFKKNPIKAPTAVSTTITSDFIFHQSQYWQLGDVVSVMDVDNGIFYAQIHGFLQDQYCEKSAVITWLLPTTASPRDSFDPATYIIGPEEDIPRPMSCFEFVMHAPSAYFRDKTAPYPTTPSTPELGYICTSRGPEIRRLPPKEEIFGLRELDSEVPGNPADKLRTKEGEKKRKREPKERKNQKGDKKEKTAAKEKTVPKDTKPKETVKEKVPFAQVRSRRDRGKAKSKEIS